MGHKLLPDPEECPISEAQLLEKLPGMSKKALWRARKDGLPHLRLGRKVFYYWHEVEAHMRGKKAATDSGRVLEFDR